MTLLSVLTNQGQEIIYHLTEKSGWGVESIMASDFTVEMPHPLPFESKENAKDVLCTVLAVRSLRYTFKQTALLGATKALEVITNKVFSLSY